MVARLAVVLSSGISSAQTTFRTFLSLSKSVAPYPVFAGFLASSLCLASTFVFCCRLCTAVISRDVKFQSWVRPILHATVACKIHKEQISVKSFVFSLRLRLWTCHDQSPACEPEDSAPDSGVIRPGKDSLSIRSMIQSSVRPGSAQILSSAKVRVLPAESVTIAAFRSFVRARCPAKRKGRSHSHAQCREVQM